MTKEEKRRVVFRFAVFFILGLALGLVEDLIVIKLATDARITLHVVEVALLVAFPFAVISEIFIDFHLFKSLFDKKWK